MRTPKPGQRAKGRPPPGRRPSRSRGRRKTRLELIIDYLRGKPAEERRPDPPAPRRRAAGRALYWGTVLVLWAGIGFAAFAYYYIASVPDPLMANLKERPPDITVLASDGTVLAERGLRHDHIRLDQLPSHLTNAVLATEDRRFRAHIGVDPLGVGRAMLANIKAGAIVEGGSTITQQLAKNLFLSPERTVARKVREIILALWLEMRFTKDEILELYLNRVYFGAGAYGVEAAAERYFGNSAREVTLAESALLVGLLKAPSRYAPTSSPDLAQERASVVLSDMVSAHMIAPDRAMAAMAEPATVKRGSGDTGYEYAVDWVAELLPSLIGERRANLVVETTLDPHLQRETQTVVTEIMAARGKRLEAGQAAAVVLDTEGAVKALVGGTSHADSQFNRAVKALRQPGSAFKPFVYLAALEAGYTPDTRVNDAPVTIDGWSPRNHKDEYRGRVTLREGLAKSINTVAVRLGHDVGTGRVARTARRLGIDSDLHSNPSLALGTAEVTLLDLTAAYVPFANGGYGTVPHIVRRIRTEDGDVLYTRRTTGRPRVVAPRYVGAMNDMLGATMVSGTSRGSALPDRPSAGKTGTSQRSRDAWFVGYTGNYVGGVWVGNDDGAPMKGVTGAMLPARMWKSMMIHAHAGVRPAPLPSASAPAVVQRREPRRNEGAELPWHRERSFLKRMFGAMAPQG